MINKRFAAALAAVMLLSGCTLPSIGDNAGGSTGKDAENSVSLAPIQSEAASTGISEQTDDAEGSGNVIGNPGNDAPADIVVARPAGERPIICDKLPDFGAAMSDEDKGNYDMYKPVAEEIINKLVAKDASGISELFGEPTGHAFDFISGIDFTGTEIKEDTAQNFTYFAKVRLNVSGGNQAVFPQGEAEWLLAVAYGADAPISYFGPAATYYDCGAERENIYNFCYNTSKQFGVFDTTNDLSQLGSRDNLTNPEFYFGLPQALRYAGKEGSAAVMSEELYSRSVLLDSAKRTYNLSGLDPSVCGDFYDSATETLSIPARGGTWMFWRPIKHDTIDNIHTVTIDYYADEGYLIKAKTMVYTVEETTDGLYKMVSVEKTYENSSLELAMGCV